MFPRVRKIIPALGKIILTAGKIIPITGKVIPRAGKIIPTAGKIIPTAGKVFPRAGDESLAVAPGRGALGEEGGDAFVHVFGGRQLFQVDPLGLGEGGVEGPLAPRPDRPLEQGRLFGGGSFALG